MNFQAGQLYHIYNRGNNKQRIFFSEANYAFFLKKVQNHLVPVCDILNYCLMPNHFHFMIHASEQTLATKTIGRHNKNSFSEGLRTLLSSYAQAINKQNSSTGSLFQQNTKARCLNEGSDHYGEICFHYIHQNPCRAGLVQSMEDWKHSSFAAFAGLRNDTICNVDLAFRLLGIDRTLLKKELQKNAFNEILNHIL
jgi:putative transposase